MKRRKGREWIEYKGLNKGAKIPDVARYLMVIVSVILLMRMI